MAKRIYISGQITGLEQAHVERIFNDAEFRLLEQGWDVVNPLTIVSILLFTEDQKRWENYMIEDLKALIKCDAIYMLRNWTMSRGARIEHDFAVAMGIQVYYQSQVLEVQHG